MENWYHINVVFSKPKFSNVITFMYKLYFKLHQPEIERALILSIRVRIFFKEYFQLLYNAQKRIFFSLVWDTILPSFLINRWLFSLELHLH